MSFDNTITSANSTGSLSVPGVFPAAVSMEGYSADASVALDAFDMAEERMGVDGHLAAGYVPTPKPVKLTFEANSPTLSAMTTWSSTQMLRKSLFAGEMVFNIPSIGKRYTFVKGYFKTTSFMPAGKKVLDPVECSVVFERVEVENI